MTAQTSSNRRLVIEGEPCTPGDFPETSYDQWRAQVEADLRGAPFEKKLVSRLYEGVEVQPLYTDRQWPHAEARSGFAGLPPLTRGAQLLATSRNGWDLRQEHKDPRLDRLNKAILDDLTNGVTSVLLRFDLAARQGLDPDAPEAAGLVGRDGAAVFTADDLDRALEGVHLDMITLALEAGAAFLPAAGLVMAVWAKRGLDASQCRAAFNADPLAVLARDGSLPLPLSSSYDQLAKLTAHTAARYPSSTSIRVGSAPYHHAGADAVQDLACSIATGAEYLRELASRGVGVDEAARQMVFSYAVGCNQFLAIGKLRAARRLWARVVEVCGGGENARRMTMHVRASKRVLTNRDPWVNLLRNTACCFAAAAAGADVVTSAPFDEAIGLASEHSRRIARNTQTILAEEAHVHRVADPSGGSWFIESLTDELAEKAWAMFREIEVAGGMAAALRSGMIGERIAAVASKRERNVATRRDGIVGVSEFANPGESSIRPERVDPLAVLGEARRRVLAGRPDDASASLGPDAGVDELAAAASAGASIGRLAGALRFGDGEAIDAAVAPHPYAAPFEELRNAADAFEARAGYRPAVFLVNMGTPADYNARAGFATNLFEAGGLRVINPGGFDTVEAATAAFAASGASVAVICSTDERYERDAEALAPRLHAAGARTVVLAGRGGEREDAYRAAGIDRFVFMRCDAVEILTELLREEQVL